MESTVVVEFAALGVIAGSGRDIQKELDFAVAVGCTFNLSLVYLLTPVAAATAPGQTRPHRPAIRAI